MQYTNNKQPRKTTKLNYPLAVVSIKTGWAVCETVIFAVKLFVLAGCVLNCFGCLAVLALWLFWLFGCIFKRFYNISLADDVAYKKDML